MCTLKQCLQRDNSGTFSCWFGSAQKESYSFKIMIIINLILPYIQINTFRLSGSKLLGWSISGAGRIFCIPRGEGWLCYTSYSAAWNLMSGRPGSEFPELLTFWSWTWDVPARCLVQGTCSIHSHYRYYYHCCPPEKPLFTRWAPLEAVCRANPSCACSHAILWSLAHVRGLANLWRPVPLP